MKIIYIINKLSLLFIIINTPAIFLSYKINQMLFLYYFLLIMIGYAIKVKIGNIFYIYPLFFIPIINAKSFFDFLFCLIIAISSIYLLNENKTSYYSFFNEFEYGLKIIAGITLLFAITLNLTILNQYISGYILVYLVTSIILLRTLRYLNINDNLENISKYNFIINFSITSLAIIISIEKLREIILYYINLIYQKLIDIFFYIFSWLLLLIGLLFDFIRKGINSKLKNGGIKINQEPNDIEKVKELTKQSLLNNNLYEIIVLFIKIILTLLFLYIIYKIIFLNKHLNSKKEEKFTEEREFIIKSQIKNSLLKRTFSIFKPKNNNEIIRMYYARFLKRLKSKIPIHNSDTSLSIKQKSDLFLDNSKNEQIRNIYIKARYSNHLIEDSIKNKFVKLVKQIKLKK